MKKTSQVKEIPDKNILLFKTCVVSTEYPGVESSTKYVFDKLGIEYHVDERQSCCTGLGHYYDLFDQFSTTVVGARNFYVAKDSGHENIATMCSTCYAIMKKVAKILNSKEDVLKDVNDVFLKSDLDHLIYTKGNINPTNNIFHVVELLYNKREEISKIIDIDLSSINIASHHACHYCKVQYQDVLEGVRNPKILDEIIKSCGGNSLDWYDHKRVTCGSGFRQRFQKRDMSLEVTFDKLESLKNSNVELLIHMCPNCQMQFDRYQDKIAEEHDTEINTYHLNIAQFIALALGADPYKTVGIQTHSVKLEPFVEKINKLYNNFKTNTINEKFIENKQHENSNKLKEVGLND